MFMLRPAFIRADASNKTDKDKLQPTSPKQVQSFYCTRFIELAILLSIVIGAHLAYLEDSNAKGRNCRVSYCRFSDTTLYSTGNSEGNVYAAGFSLLAGDSLCHPAMRALRSIAL